MFADSHYSSFREGSWWPQKRSATPNHEVARFPGYTKAAVPATTARSSAPDNRTRGFRRILPARSRPAAVRHDVELVRTWAPVRTPIQTTHTAKASRLRRQVG